HPLRSVQALSGTTRTKVRSPPRGLGDPTDLLPGRLLGLTHAHGDEAADTLFAPGRGDNASVRRERLANAISAGRRSRLRGTRGGDSGGDLRGYDHDPYSGHHRKTSSDADFPTLRPA